MNEKRTAFMAIQADEALKEKTRRRMACQSKRKVRYSWRMAVAAIMALVLFGSGFGYYTITAEAAYVSVETAGMETEPSLGLSINRWGNVIRAEGLNEAGKIVLTQVDPTGMSYEEALQALLEATENLGYVAEDMQIDFSVCAGAENALVQKLQDTSQAVVEQVCPYANGDYGWASWEVRQNANGYGMTCNRYQLAEAIMELDENVTIEDCSQYTLHQLYCWYQALCDGQKVTVENVPEICTQYGCGIRGNAGQGNGHRGGRWR